MKPKRCPVLPKYADKKIGSLYYDAKNMVIYRMIVDVRGVKMWEELKLEEEPDWCAFWTRLQNVRGVENESANTGD